MASIEGRTATFTRPPLISNARSESRNTSSVSALTATQRPPASLIFESSLAGENRVSRAPSRRTQASPSISRSGDMPKPKTLQLVPRASKWCDSSAGLRGIRGRDRHYIGLLHGGRDGQRVELL